MLEKVRDVQAKLVQLLVKRAVFAQITSSFSMWARNTEFQSLEGGNNI
jgi:hypothetical protein